MLLNTSKFDKISIKYFKYSMSRFACKVVGRSKRKMVSLSTNVTSNLEFLIALAEASSSQASHLMKHATAEHLWALRDAANDLLNFKVQLTVLQRECLQPHADIVRALGYATTLPSIEKVLRLDFKNRLLLLQVMVIPVIEHIETTYVNPGQRD